MNIEIVSGSPHKNSVTYRLALHLKKYFSEKTSHHIDIIDVRNYEFKPDMGKVYPSVENAPEEHKEIAKRMFGADAFIIVTPEYNGSYTSYIKNLFDHFPKQLHKPFGIVSGSPGQLGGIRACLQLQLLICALFGIASPYMLVTPQVDKKFSPDGELLEPLFQNAIDVFTAEFLWLAEKIKN